MVTANDQDYIAISLLAGLCGFASAWCPISQDVRRQLASLLRHDGARGAQFLKTADSQLENVATELVAVTLTYRRVEKPTLVSLVDHVPRCCSRGMRSAETS